jgi:hypothetical protein
MRIPLPSPTDKFELSRRFPPFEEKFGNENLKKFMSTCYGYSISDTIVLSRAAVQRTFFSIPVFPCTAGDQILWKLLPRKFGTDFLL